MSSWRLVKSHGNYQKGRVWGVTVAVATVVNLSTDVHFLDGVSKQSTINELVLECQPVNYPAAAVR